MAYFFANVSGLRGVLAKTNNPPAWRKAGALYLFIALQFARMFAPLLAGLWVINPERAMQLLAVFSEEGLRETLSYLLLGFLAAFPFLGWVMSWERRRYESWGRLRIDDESAS